MRAFFLLFVIVGVLCIACAEEAVDSNGSPYTFRKPANFPEAAYTFENNPVTQKGFELGRALFYDPILSADSTIACANCHQQAAAFADPVHTLSRGVMDRSGTRNAPAIQNMAFQRLFFWDGGVKHLDFVPINAITSDVEMAEKIAHVVEKLQRNPSYVTKFNEAYQEPPSSQKMLYALSQFMNLMVSANSRYDHYVRKEGESLTTAELNGLQLFTSKCSSCHATDLFTDGSFRNNGLDATFEKDNGRERITELAEDKGKFKVPSLRNVELTDPYMHDGRFKTLEQVLDHYATGVVNSETLDLILKRDEGFGIPLTIEEKANIILFLKTLTDREFILDKRFSFPANSFTK
ncbi:MAG: cytochrome-c peroxidase [Cyclobacteriaceae bacterium]|nr:cytochrome-c peroxidase [Cyclobacteriaceae bacterium]